MASDAFLIEYAFQPSKQFQFRDKKFYKSNSIEKHYDKSIGKTIDKTIDRNAECKQQQKKTIAK